MIQSHAWKWMMTGAVLATGSLCGCATQRMPEFRMHVINADSPYEAATAFDVNGNGKLDIWCGAYWYEAPTWRKHFVREIQAKHGYHDDFAAIPVDVDGDGRTDVITATWFSKKVAWIRNTGDPQEPFKEYLIANPGNCETAILADISGNGQPDVLPNVFGDKAVWYEFRPDPTAPGGARWIEHPLPVELSAHGIGAGDITGNGLTDIVGRHGWAEQTGNPDRPWIWHADFDLGSAGSPIVIDDVDGDGLADIVWGIGHDYGFYWMEQGRDAHGRRTWTKHEIDRSWSQAHVVLAGDLTGDGQNEYVTGKRWYAHNGRDPGAEEPRCIYAYRFDRETRRWTRHTIHEGGPAGIGIYATLVDIDGDGDLDLVVGGKSGLYLFENLRIP